MRCLGSQLRVNCNGDSFSSSIHRVWSSRFSVLGREGTLKRELQTRVPRWASARSGGIGGTSSKPVIVGKGKDMTESERNRFNLPMVIPIKLGNNFTRLVPFVRQ